MLSLVATAASIDSYPRYARKNSRQSELSPRGLCQCLIGCTYSPVRDLNITAEHALWVALALLGWQPLSTSNFAEPSHRSR